MTPIESQVRAALDDVTDPCSQAFGVPAGLLEMGLVRRLEITPDRAGPHAEVVLRVTDAGCLLGAEFVAAVETRLATVPGLGSFAVELDHAVDWSPDDMSSSYRRRLERVRRGRGVSPVIRR